MQQRWLTVEKTNDATLWTYKREAINFARTMTYEYNKPCKVYYIDDNQKVREVRFTKESYSEVDDDK